MLDEDHLVCISESAPLRIQFGLHLTRFVRRQRGMEVCQLHGRNIANMEDFCAQLERLIPGPMLARQIDGPRGAVSLLRRHEDPPGMPAHRHRFYLWHDADVLLSSDAGLFGALVDAMLGVSAEFEYSIEDALLLQRGVFCGGGALGAYWRDERGQFRSWKRDAFREPFWHAATGIEAPSTSLVHLDSLITPNAGRGGGAVA